MCYSCVFHSIWQAATHLHEKKTLRSNTQVMNNVSMNNGYIVQSRNKINHDQLWVILSLFTECFCTNNLQFGFKKGMSTSLCTGFVKCVVTQYLSNESPLDLSKAFNLLFRRLLDRSLPLPIAHLLMTWYCDQNMRVRWNQTLSISFSVTNGVRQGGRSLSNFVHSLYRRALKQLDVGCHCYISVNSLPTIMV